MGKKNEAGNEELGSRMPTRGEGNANRKDGDGGVKEMAGRLKELAGQMERQAEAAGAKGAANSSEDGQGKALTYYLGYIVSELETMTDFFNYQLDITSNLTGKERQRLTSARVRNNGFIDKAFDVAHDNPSFLPPHFNVYALRDKMSEFELLRQLMAVVDQLQRSVQDAFIIQADDCFKDALRIYNSLQEQKNGRVPGAASLFEVLSIYFKNRGKTSGEPTAKQLERDVKRLLKGKADGEIVIKNEAPHLTGGVHEVIDDIHTGRKSVKGTVEESEKE